MKSKDFFNKLKETGKIDAEDFVKMIDVIPEFEIPDNAFKAFEDKFMTVERASAHPEVTAKLRSQHLMPLDSDIDKIVSFIEKIDKYLGIDISKHTKVTSSGDKIKDTYKQMAAITDVLPKLFEKAKVPSDDAEMKKQIEEYKKSNHELMEKFKTVDHDWNEKLKLESKGFEEKLSAFKRDTYLEKLSSNYTFADAYEKTRDVLQKSILGDLKAKHNLAYAENNGETSIEVVEVKDGVPRPKFNGNTPVTIQALLDEAYKQTLTSQFRR